MAARRSRGEAGRRAAARAAARVERVDWAAASSALDAVGYARLGRLLDARSCAALRRAFEDDARFRSTIVMGPRRYGEGTYRYLAYPLPPRVQALREALYPPLAAIANRWWERLGRPERFEPRLEGFLQRCHAAGQERPTPLLLRYRRGGYNRLHQDLYGALAFPLQVVVLLSQPGEDFEGGELLLTESRPRMQSRGHAVRLRRGEALAFPNAVRPVEGPRGFARAELRHGVSDVLSGERIALGIIFHDAK